MTVKLVSAAERPDLVQAAEAMSAGLWPAYLKTQALLTYWDELYSPSLSRFQTIATDATTDEVIAVGNSVPFLLAPECSLPDTGWDWVIEQGVRAARDGTPVNSLSALAVTISPAHRGSGLAVQLLEAMKPPARAMGLTDMVGPVRPTLKARYPLQDFATYCGWRRSDGELFDPWLRTHERLGATIIGPATRSMTVTATIAEWENWTGLRFPASAAYAIAGALAPLQIDLETGLGTYAEPNLWMRHPLG